MDEVLLGLVESAGEKGVTVSAIKKTGGKDVPSEQEIRARIQVLKTEGKISGPYKNRYDYYFSPHHAPSPEKTKAIIEKLLKKQSPKLASKSAVQKKVPGFAAKSFEDALRLLVAEGRVAILKAGSGKYLLHWDSLSELFPSIPQESTPRSAAPTGVLPSWPEIVSVYRELAAARGGFGSVPIGALIHKLGVNKEAFHRLLLEQARAQKADLHPATSTNLTSEDIDGLLKVPESKEAFVNTTLRE